MRARMIPVFAGVVVCLALSLARPAAGEIVLRQKYPVEKSPTDLYIQDADGTPVTGAAVSVTYRPGSSVSRTEDIGVTGKGGRVEWTPHLAGIATLNATWDGGTSTTNVSVRFAHTPLGGVAIMLLAGLLLVGGSVVRIMRIMKAPE